MMVYAAKNTIHNLTVF